ncbi:MAG: ribosome recycling factor [Patescibacteria group bacterium]
MVYSFNEFKSASDTVLGWLKKEYASIRTGRATPSILDNVSVSAYGSKVSINQVASVTVEGAKSLRIIPWDKTLAGAVDSAIRESNLGLSVSVDDSGLRVAFPDLSSERRAQLLKLAKEKTEEARIRIRSEREKILNDVDKKEKDGAISKDEKFRLKNELQKIVDETNKKFEEISEKKEKEINE